jgi:hypothetical protein
MTNVSEDSGLGGKVLIQLICRARNLNPVEEIKMIMKLTLKRSTSFVKFFTIIDYHGKKTHARAKFNFHIVKNSLLRHN